MRRVFFYVTAILAGLIGGGGAAVLALNPAGGAANIQNGPWRTSDRYGAPNADLLTRAIVARVGLFALSRKETIYYSARTDSTGAPLDGACQYRVIGPVPAARWWSITAYGANHYLIASEDGRYSVGVRDMPANEIDFVIAHRTQGALSPPLKGPFSLTMRIYDPSPATYENLSDAPLPDIVREGC